MFDKALLSLPGIKRILGLLGLLAVLKAAAIIGSIWALSTAIANLWAGAAFNSQALFVGAFLGCFLARQVVVYAQDALLARYAREQGARLRDNLLDQAFTGSVGWVRSHGTASVTTAALDGIDQVENYLHVVLPKLVDASVVVPATLIATVVLDWVSAVILIIVVPVIIFYMILLGRMAQDRATRQYATYQVMSNHFIDTLRGLGTLKALGAGKRQLARIFKVSENFRRATVKTLYVATLSGAVLDLLATLGVAAVAMMLGFRLVDGTLDLFTGLAALMLAPEYFAPLRQFAGDFHASLDGKNALADILALTEHPEEAVSPASEIEPWSESSTLELKDISFAYPSSTDEDASPTLNKVNLQARGFERIGLIGASGSGKSTLASLIGGFHTPQSGRIAIDGAALPLDALQHDSWRSQVLYIPQNPYIFHATLRQNITFYTPDASDGDVAHAIDVMGLERLVQELPDGLDTVIGEGGRGLSGGQAHRIALARALLDSSRRILIFDEPTAHLDIETELELKERMVPLMEGRLVFFATHRRHWLGDMDRVYSLVDGKLVEVVLDTATGAAGGGRQGHAPLFAKTFTGRFRSCAPLAERQRRAVFAYSENCEDGAQRPLPTPSGSPGSDDHASTVPQQEKPETAASTSPVAKNTREGGDDGAETASDLKRDVWVRPYFGKYRGQMGQALVFGVGAAAFAALLMFTAGYLISGTAEARGSILFYYLPIAFVQLFGLTKPVLRYFERLRSHDWVFRITSSLRVRLFKSLESRRTQRHESLGKVLGTVAEDIGHIQNLYLRSMFPLIIAWITLALAVVAFGVFDWAFAGVAFVCLGLAGVVFPAALARATQNDIRACKRLKDGLYENLTDDMLGSADWVLAGRGRECRARNHMQAARSHDAQDKVSNIERASILATSSFLALFNGLALWWAAMQFGGVPGGDANWIAAFILGLFPLMESVSLLPTAAIRANEHRFAIEDLNEFPDVDDNIDIPETPAPATASHDIDVSQLAYAYPGGGRYVLDGVSLDIPAGQRIAMLGPSGSGKSTFASLLRGELAPTSGAVELGGIPTTQFGDAVAGFIGVVEQNPYLFNRTVRDNLLLARPDATDDDIWRVLEHVQLADLVRGLPRGLATMMDEAGMRFSGGERHRIALARVLLADTPIILLDEPTVGLDPETEQGILDTLLGATQGKTLILITHHLQGIEAFDRVVFLEDGRIEIDGSPTELAATNERYQQLLAFDGIDSTRA